MPPQDPSFGPFTDILSKPLYEQTGVPPTTSGLGGKGEKSLFFVDKFLEGMQRGRQMQFERHEQDQRKLYGTIQDAYQRIEQSNVPDDVKEQARGKLDALRIGVMAKHVDDATGKGGKGGKGGEGQGKEQQMLHFVKSGLDAMIGPRPKQYEMGQEQINKGLLDVYSSISDPKNSTQGRLSALQEQFASVRQDIKKRLGIPDNQEPTQAQISADPRAQQLFTAMGNLTGGKSLAPGVAQYMASLEPGDEQSRLVKQKTEAEIERDKAQAEEYKARAKAYAEGKPVIKQNSDGEPITLHPDGSASDANGNKIPAEDPRLHGLHDFGKQKDYNWSPVKNSFPPTEEIPATGEKRTLRGEDGKPLTIRDALYRESYMNAVRNGQTNYRLDRAQVLGAITQIDGLVKKSHKEPLSEKESQQLSELQQFRTKIQQRVDAYERTTETPPGGPKPKKGKVQPTSPNGSLAAQTMQDAIRSAITGQPMKKVSPTGQPPQKQPTAEEYAQ